MGRKNSKFINSPIPGLILKETPDEHGLIGLSLDVSSEMLVYCYQNGIFPWPISDEPPVTWFSPNPRSVIFLAELKINRSDKRALARSDLTTSVNQAFNEVITACGSSRSTTWITPQIIQSYQELHQQGVSLSIETWQAGKLVGGLYGVKLGKYFSGESMFHSESDASKVAFYRLVLELQKLGIEWIDCQQSTLFFEKRGAVELNREFFLKLLAQALSG